jgi:ubiquinone/menaquinone biosynthesis C-methylase UbiE
MRIGFVAENLPERLFLASGVLPELAIVPFFSTVVGNAVMTAQRYGLFELLKQPRTLAEIVDHTKTDKHGAEVLLESLSAFGYLERKNGRFQVSRKFAGCLNGKGSDMATAMLGFAPDVGRRFEKLDESLRTGEVENFHFTPITPNSWANYLSFLKGVSQMPASALVKKVRFSAPPAKMLDIAGGPAQYSIAFCRKYPSLEAVILDLPESAAAGEREIEIAGLSARISYRVGDFFETDWGAGYDLALVSNILHCLSAEQCQTIINKAFAALNPGGLLVTNDVDFPGENETIPFTAGWSSLLYFAMMGTRTHPTPAVRKWLEAAGFENIRKTNIRTTAQLIGHKP